MPFADIGEVAGDCGCGGHHGAHQVGASASPLAPFEVAIAGGGAALAGSQDIGVHAQAHGAAGLAPVKTSGAKDFIETFLFGLLLHLLRSGNHHRTHLGMDVVSAHYFGRGAKIFNAGVGAGADEDTIDGQLFDGLARLERHVFERTLPGAAFRVPSGWRRDRARDR